jgi:hypothetical protein
MAFTCINGPQPDRGDVLHRDGAAALKSTKQANGNDNGNG